MRFALMCTLLLAGAAQAAGEPAKKEKIAVLPFVSKSGDGELISQVLATMLIETKTYTIVDRAHIQRVMDEKQIKALEATDEQLLAAVAIAAADLAPACGVSLEAAAGNTADVWVFKQF